MAKKRVWGPPDKKVIVNHDDLNVNAAVSDVVVRHGEIAITSPANQKAAGRLQHGQLLLSVGQAAE